MKRIEGQGDGGGDRLPLLIMNYFKEGRERYARHFSADLREGADAAQQVIDFSGSKLVANFGTLQASAISKSIHLIKRRLWDLKVERDRDPMHRQHEMILQRPFPDDSQITERQ
jgi:hypothetical protein